MKNIGLWVCLIVASLAASVWLVLPFKEKIKLGKDLRGGTSVVYTVSIPEGGNSQEILTQVISVLKERVNPQGVIDISFQPQGRDRIEIVMPLPNAEVQALKKQFDEALTALTASSVIAPADLDAALAEKKAAERFGAFGGERAARMQALQDAYNARETADAALKQAQTAGASEVELRPREQALADAELAFDDQREQVLRLSLDERRLRSVLQLSKTPKRDSLTGEVIPGGSPREEALTRLKSEFAGLPIDPVAQAFDAYQGKRAGFDDVEDLIRLLRGAGVLEFYIAAHANDTAVPVNVEDLRKQLAERGPQNIDSPLARWFPINDVAQWYPANEPSQLEALQKDPVRYFAGRYNLIAASKDGRYYLLLYTGPAKTMTHAGGADWTVERAFPTQDQLGRQAVGFRLDQAGGAMMSRLTGPNVNQPMAIVLDGQVYSAPNLQSQIGTNGIIQGSFNNAELAYLTRVLAAGALAARLSPDPIAINTIGPSLGRDNLDRGLRACAYSAVAVGAFMIIYYLFPGLVAVLAVLAHVLLTFALMSFINGTFTLPGLAGIALSVGMAVDANVLVYERIREEFSRGHDLRAAIRLGYQRALTAIVDGNICNLLVCVVLYQTATAEVKGFALTMICGVATTLFTSLTMTRVVFEFVLKFFKPKSFPTLPTVSPLLNRFLHPHIDWIGLRRFFLPFSAAMVVGSIALAVYTGPELFDTEFRGGVSATMRTREGLLLSRSDVEHRIRSIGEHAGATDPVLHGLRRASVATVGESQLDPATRELLASAFQLKATIPAGAANETAAADKVVHAIVDEFKTEIAAKPPLTFEGAGTDQLASHTFPITKRTLGENIRRKGVDASVQDKLGGVAIVLDAIKPAATLEDIAARIRTMREQPDFSDLAGRPTRVIGMVPLDPEHPEKGYLSAAVVVSDPEANFEKVDFNTWESRMAKAEWSLVSQALTRGVSLEQVSTFSSAVAETLKANAVVAIVLSLIGILVYIWIRFSSLVYSAAAVACLVHDVSIAIGLLALSHYVAGTAVGSALLIEDFRIDLGVVAALLTLNGYSLNDTIVVMDRIRENRGKLPMATAKIINESINQTFSRTIITSFTVFLSTLVLYIVGGTGIRPFAFCFLVGVVFGTYSSIAIAAPIVVRRGDKSASSGTPLLADEPAMRPSRELGQVAAS